MRTIIRHLADRLWGKRCHAIIIGEKGSDRYYMASEIHTSRQSAEAHRQRIEETRTYVYITTITFRWRR